MKYRVRIDIEVDVPGAENAEDEAFRLLWLHFYQGEAQGVKVEIDPVGTD